MKEFRKSTIVEIAPVVDERLRGTVRSFLQALEYVDSLCHLQKGDDLSFVIENVIFNKIIQTLKSGGTCLPYQDRAEYEKRIELLTGSIYDLSGLTLNLEGKEYIDLILGKVFSLDKDDCRRYSGAIGFVDESFAPVIEAYDSKLDFFASKLPTGAEQGGFSIKEKTPIMRCINVFSLAGELNIRHKPICVFFSGENSTNLSSLSRITVFINHYALRFQLISKEIAKKYVGNYPVIENLDYDEISRLLLIWLRGHDVGHFYGKDSLVRGLSGLDKIYLILHELKSDALALYNLRFLDDNLLKDDLKIKAYSVSMAEMLRYIRRGRFYTYPDSASAFLTYSYLKENGSIRFDKEIDKFIVDFDRLEMDVENLTKEVLEIFAHGDLVRANELVNRWGDMRELGRENLPGELSLLEDTAIPYYIDFNFITKNRILFSNE